MFSPKKRFSLIELMVATALGMLIMMIVGFAFKNSSTATQRSLALVSIDQQQQEIIDLLQDDLQCLNPLYDVQVTPTSITFAKSISDTLAAGTIVKSTVNVGDMNNDVVLVTWDWSDGSPTYNLKRSVYNAKANTTETVLVQSGVLNFNLKLFSSYNNLAASPQVPLAAPLIIDALGSDGYNATPAAARILYAQVSFVLSNMTDVDLNNFTVSATTVVDDIKNAGKIATEYKATIRLPDAG